MKTFKDTHLSGEKGLQYLNTAFVTQKVECAHCGHCLYTSPVTSIQAISAEMRQHEETHNDRI